MVEKEDGKGGSFFQCETRWNYTAKTDSVIIRLFFTLLQQVVFLILK